MSPRMRYMILIMDLKNLMMLSMCYFYINVLPEHIGGLKLLSSLNFSYIKIVQPQFVT